jgi:hypothetical protein
VLVVEEVAKGSNEAEDGLIASVFDAAVDAALGTRVSVGVAGDAAKAQLLEAVGIALDGLERLARECPG